MNKLLEYLKNNYKSYDLCKRYDELKIDWVTEEDLNEADTQDSLEAYGSLYTTEASSQLCDELKFEIKDKIENDFTFDDEVEFEQYIDSGDWVFEL